MSRAIPFPARRWLAALAIGLLAGSVLAMAPASAATRSFDVPTQPAVTGIPEFARQANVQILVSGTLVRGKRTNAVRGVYSPEEALSKLLDGMGLRFEILKDSSTIVVRPVTPAAESNAGAQPPIDAAVLRLTQARVPEQTNNSPARGTPSPDDADLSGVPELLVRGNRSLNADIRRSEDAPQPYVVFGSDEIGRSQAVNLEDFLRMRLPMNAASMSAGQNPGSPYTVSGFDLRGLGAQQTLILVDGRRMPGTSSGVSLAQPDLNGISLAMVERIEVLPSTASGIYGGGATGGVINVILRRDPGFTVAANYANTFDSDAGSLRLDAVAGFNIGRTRVTVAASHSAANTLLVGDRDFATRALALQFANNPASILNSGTPPLRNTVNIRGVSGNLVLDPAYGGTALGSRITHLPAGYAGPASDNGAALVANAGTYNLDMPGGVLGLERGLLAAPSMESVTLNLRRELGERVEVFLDASRLGNEGRSNAAAIVPNIVVNLAADAPNNPFQQNINVRFPTPGLSFESRSESTTARLAGGLMVRLPCEWTAGLDYGWSRSRSRAISTGAIIDSVGQCVIARGVAASVDPDGAGPLTPCAATDPRPALNALQEGNAFPIDFTPYLLPSPNVFQGPYDTVLKDATVRISGPLAQLPGGPLTLSALVERRDEKMQDAFQRDADAASGAAIYTLYPHRSQDVNSYYLEAQVPVVSAQNGRPLLRKLDLQLSVRRDRYTTRSDASFGIPVTSPSESLPPLDYATNRLSSTDYTAGVRFVPVEGIVLRASVGSGFVPPSVSQIAPSRMLYPYPLGTDPKRGNTLMYVGVPYLLIQGGSPGLNPERSSSRSVGIILTPRFIPGLRVSVDYTRVAKRDEIRTPAFQYVLDNEDALAGRIVRGANLPDDPVGWSGPITVFNVSSLNLARTSVTAYDIQADYVLQVAGLGEIGAHAIATWQPHYSSRLSPADPQIDSAGFAGGPLKWRGNLGLDWSRGPLIVSWNAQYYDSYRAYSASSAPAAIATTVLNQGSATVSRELYHDLIAAYRFGRTLTAGHPWLADSEISVGVQNLFGTSPPILASTSPANAGYSTYGDPRLRRYSLSLRKFWQ